MTNDKKYYLFFDEIQRVEKWELTVNSFKALHGEKVYFQVVYVLADETVIEREFGVYRNIQDNYLKYVISTDTFDMSQDGIIHKNIIDWLLEEEK